jgi:hypothetical protein
MLPAVAAVVLALEEPGVSTASTTAVFKRTATPVAMAAWVSAIPFQGVQFTTVVVVVVGATTTTCLQQIPMGWVGSVEVATVPELIERKVLMELPIPVAVVAAVMRKASVGRADPAW